MEAVAWMTSGAILAWLAIQIWEGYVERRDRRIAEEMNEREQYRKLKADIGELQEEVSAIKDILEVKYEASSTSFGTTRLMLDSVRLKEIESKLKEN